MVQRWQMEAVSTERWPSNVDEEIMKVQTEYFVPIIPCTCHM